MTSVEENHTDETEPQLLHEIVGDVPPESLMEQLRARRDEIANSHDTFISIAGYENVGLSVRYNLIERANIEQIGQKVLKETKNRGERNMLILLDTIIQATEGFYIQRATDATPQPLEDMEGNHIRLWGHLADFLGQRTTTARDAVYFVFGNNEFAIGAHGIALNRWMGNTSIDVDSELLGE